MDFAQHFCIIKLYRTHYSLSIRLNIKKRTEKLYTLYNGKTNGGIRIAITVKDALQLPIMQTTKLVAGSKGIENKIKWVTIVEVLEDIERIQDGEFLITTGFNLLEDENRMEVFHNLLRLRPLSGVAIYTSFYMEKIPESFIALADKHHLPLIEIPTDINFSEITKVVLQHIVNKQTRLLEQSENIHHELSTMILNDQSLTEVTNRLAQLTDSEICIYNEFYEISYTSSNSSFQTTNRPSKIFFTTNQQEIDISKYLLCSLEKEAKEHIQLEDQVITIYPIIAKQSCFGWIVMVKATDQWQELDDIAIERAASIYAMEFLKVQAVEETQLRLQSNLLEDIFSKNYLNERFIIDQALKLNYDLTVNQTVFYITFLETKKVDIHLVDRLYLMVEHLLIQKSKAHMMQTKLQSIILLTNINGNTEDEQYNQAVQLAKELQGEWNYYFPNHKLLIGIGKFYDQVDQLGRSAKEAQYAAKLTNLIDAKKNITHYSDLGMYDLLLEMNQKGIDLSEIYKDNIYKLLAGEREIDLIETIDAYFKNSQSIQRTAEKLFIHRHTLRYRLNQIEQRTGLSLKSTDDLLKLQLGIMAYKLVNILNQNNT